MMTEKQIEDALYYNRKKGVSLTPFTSAAVDSRQYVKVVATFQEAHGLKVDGKCGPVTATAFRQELLDGGAVKILNREHLVEVAKTVARFEGNFWTLNRDGEFRGLFDRPSQGKWHWASSNNPDKPHGEHLGLSYGFLQFNQAAGSLGEVLLVMREADPEAFLEIFGPASDDLVEVTNRQRGKARLVGDGLRNNRVQPVEGHDLWVGDHWPERFKRAGRHEPFQRAQLRYAVKMFMTPALALCDDLGLRSERALAIVFDRCVQYGPSGARNKLFTHAPRKEGEGEHAYLKRLEDRWEGQRWHHRVVKLWRDPTLWDGPCDWSNA